MILCRVLGPVVATVKHPTYHGEKLLMVQPIDEHQKARKTSSFLAVDRAQSGPGDLVLVLQEGNGARQIIGAEVLPIRSVIVGHVDDIMTA